MARWPDAHWERSDLHMVPRADRLFGPYRQYEPDMVTSRPLSLSPETNRAATVVERAVRELATGPGAEALEGLARFLLRSEAIASSLIEGIAPASTRRDTRASASNRSVPAPPHVRRHPQPTLVEHGLSQTCAACPTVSSATTP